LEGGRINSAETPVYTRRIVSDYLLSVYVSTFLSLSYVLLPNSMDESFVSSISLNGIRGNLPANIKVKAKVKVKRE